MKNPITGLLVPAVNDEDEKELRQFAVEFKSYPIGRSKAKKACEDLAMAIFQNLDQNGLLGTE